MRGFGHQAAIIAILAVATSGVARADGKPYDITRYDLRIIPDFRTHRMQLAASIRISNPAGLDTFAFLLSDKFDSVRAKTGGDRPVRVERGNGIVQVSMADAPRDLELRFDLEGSLGASDGEERRQAVDDSSLFLLWSDRFYPVDMNDWAIVSTTLVLPKRFDAIAPGRRVEVRDEGERRVQRFETSVPVCAASIFADSRWRRIESDSGGIPMVLLLHPGSERFADQITRTSREVLGFYSQTFCPYPFDGFAFVTLPGIYARRAFPGFIGYDPPYLEREMTTTGHDAHETALLWWFWTLRGSGPGAYQWTEGFGDYAEFLYDERSGKPRPTIFETFQKEYLALPPDSEPSYTELRGTNAMQPVIHGKYPMLMHVLRYRCGDEAFTRGLRLLFERFRFATFTMEEFIATMEEGTDQRLDWWRQEWLERKGVPTWRFSSDVRPSGAGASAGYDIKVTIEQIGPVYHLPVGVGIETASGLDIERLDLESARGTATFHSKAEPRGVILDPHHWILYRPSPEK